MQKMNRHLQRIRKTMQQSGTEVVTMKDSIKNEVQDMALKNGWRILVTSVVS